MLKELSLTYMIKDEVLLITTPEEADNELFTKVYPVADLVLPIPQGMGGMMGGMGGMMGGMGGGMGGMGGGMGGMGGMGMGGMGGMGMAAWVAWAAWHVQHAPRSAAESSARRLPGILRQGRPERPGKAATGEPRAEPSRSDRHRHAARHVGGRPATIDNRPAKIEIEIEEGAKPEVVWDRYFSKNDPQPKAVRDAVRRLMNEQKFDHVIALIGAALRHRQGQPWMYEALALALDAAGRPKAEIERAIMSAVDFVDNPTDLMYIGAYLSQMGLDERALQVYRQAASLAPLRPEPYMLGLRAARATNNLEGLKWASLGILSQAWPKEQADVWQAGMGVAKEVLDKLRSEKRTKEADAFEAALNEAVRRDCVAIVSWTGEGEVDLLVEEPSGTVCSLRNPRTPAGGILLGDDIRQTGRDNFGGHSQVYVCPKGFDGTYRMLVRRVWGNVTAGKVNVEVVTHCNTPNCDRRPQEDRAGQRTRRSWRSTLKDGRRKEALRDQQVANVVGGQLAVNRQILAQQLASSVDPQSLSSLAQVAVRTAAATRICPSSAAAPSATSPSSRSCPKAPADGAGRRQSRPSSRPTADTSASAPRRSSPACRRSTPSTRPPARANRNPAAPATRATAAGSAAPATAASRRHAAVPESSNRRLHFMDQRPGSNPSSDGSGLLQTLAICGFLLLAVAVGVRPDGQPRVHQPR